MQRWVVCVNVNAGYKAIVSVLYVVDCGSPELPSNAAVLAAAEGTDGSANTEGATLSFQCEEGLTPSDPTNITCTRIGNTGSRGTCTPRLRTTNLVQTDKY